MDWISLGEQILIVVYTFALVMVSIYGLHRYVLMYLYYRHRHKAPRKAGHFEQLPPVTVQLPMYNEQYVARRIIEQACRIDYPRDKLHIQVLDDSTDGTTEIAAAAVERARQGGFDIELIHRDNRRGYKAGALENGLKTAKGEFIAIFDADFVPPTDIIKKCIDYFTDPQVCVVQTRWDHINRDDSLLTRSQAIYLDGHFVIEHVARNRSGRFMCFNGTAGIWRKSAIIDSGGWQHDTLTEDMDLSYRAQLKGWKFVFLPEVTTPAELPPEMNAFKAQQFRWTKGGAQTAMKVLPRVLLSKVPLKAKIEALFQLTCFSVHFYVLILISLLFPVMYIRAANAAIYSPWRMVFDLAVFALATISANVFYIASQYELFRDWRNVLKYLPFLMGLGVGICLSNTKALLEALFRKHSEFVRTPKFGAGTANYHQLKNAPKVSAITGNKKTKRHLLPFLEFGFGIYMAICAVRCLLDPRYLLAAPFMIIFAIGFFYVSILTLHGLSAAKKQPGQPAKVAKVERRS